MDHFINKYRCWVWSIPDTTGDALACVGYMAWCGLLAGAFVAFEAGALFPTALCLGGAGLLTASAYIS
jgi:hypothetical protein